MDLSFAEYKRKDYPDALKEANLALSLEPGNALRQLDADQNRDSFGSGQALDFFVLLEPEAAVRLRLFLNTQCARISRSRRGLIKGTPRSVRK